MIWVDELTTIFQQGGSTTNQYSINIPLQKHIQPPQSKPLGGTHRTLTKQKQASVSPFPSSMVHP